MAIGALLLVAYFEPGIEEQTETPPITSLNKDQLRRIHLNRPVRDDLVLIKNAALNWIIERTPELPADNFQINMLQRLAEQKAVRSYTASELDLTQLQLTPPQATVILNDTAIEFGQLEPLQGLRYVRVADQVHLIPDLYLQLIEASYTQFVRRRLFDENIRFASIAVPGFTVVNSDQGWTVEPPQEVSADELQQFAERWQAATAVNIQAADQGTEGDTLEFVRAGSGQRVNFVISARQPELVLVRPDLGIKYRMGGLGDNLLNLRVPEAGDRE